MRDREAAAATAATRLRRRRLRTKGSEAAVIEQLSGDRQTQGRATADIDDALLGLPAEQGEVIRLRFLGSLDVDAIAARLGVSPWVVRRRLQVAVARLRLDSLRG